MNLTRISREILKSSVDMFYMKNIKYKAEQVSRNPFNLVPRNLSRLLSQEWCFRQKFYYSQYLLWFWLCKEISSHGTVWETTQQNTIVNELVTSDDKLCLRNINNFSTTINFNIINSQNNSSIPNLCESKLRV